MLVPDATAVVRLPGHTCIARVDRVEADRLWLDDRALRHIDADVLGPIPQDAVEALLFARYRPEPSDSVQEQAPPRRGLAYRTARRLPRVLTFGTTI